MDRLPTRIDKSSEDYSSRESHNSALIEELRQRVDTARNGGGAKYVERLSLIHISEPTRR